jgi:hypothetical protein
MKRSIAIAAAATLPLALFAAPAAAADDPNVKIIALNSNGSGCAAGDPAAVRTDKSDLLLTFGQGMSVLAGTGTDGTVVPNATRNCVINIQLGYSDKWQFGITEFDADGTSNLSQGATGQAIVTSYLAGMPQTSQVLARLSGPTNGPWGVGVKTPAPDWSECGKNRALNINARVQVALGEADKASKNTVTATNDDSLRARISWRKC